MASSHENITSCACKGIRSCLMCEDMIKLENNLSKQVLSTECIIKEDIENIFYFCITCKKAWQTKDKFGMCQHTGNHIDFEGVEIITDFISEYEEEELIEHIDSVKWVDSQSGRRKQDYGPKVNFKKKKIKQDMFTGLPAYSKFLLNKMKDTPVLHNFIPVELCNLEYIPNRGSSIDPHFDDFWLWGERLVTLNLLSDIQYTMTNDVNNKEVQVLIPFPRRSLAVLHGAARHQWKHSIKRSDIHFRRVGMTIRELTPEFLPGGAQEKVGKQLKDIALSFSGISVAEFEHLNTIQDGTTNGIC